MVRGAEYDNNVPSSDNPIENGPNKVHGAGSTVRPHPTPQTLSHNPHTDSIQKDADINRVHRTAELPEAAKSSGGLHSGGGSSGPTQSGSGKGGHEPKTLGENKGLGAHKA
ncbi:uncharacterized protein BDW47DRAFT_98137 [Aspergillus candidus]|uniref:Uncharacterized protein n=1 Tax=Aspergillus candidus TaxID=41067 RepID=A0A2I2FNQ0_ASPCN|nr:hypothetical protein BDW47DRAFT_98137 [Aspergillus candidus]PLB42248.1 hypothetical protein BDW47DRAFT_98137 [Aspergillus candidus]